MSQAKFQSLPSFWSLSKCKKNKILSQKNQKKTEKTFFWNSFVHVNIFYICINAYVNGNIFAVSNFSQNDKRKENMQNRYW